MAKERQVNININYKVNTADIERSEQLLKRASQSTDNLTRTTQNFSTRSSAGFRSTGTSITAMRTDLERLKTQIESTSAADTKRLQHLSAQYAKLNAQIKEQTKLYLQQTTATKATASATKDLAKGFNEVYSAVRLVIAAGILREVVQLSLDAAKLSGNIDGVAKAFNRLPAATLVLSELRQATRGTIQDFELMQTSLRAVNFGISLKALPSLLEFAAVRAQQTGVSMDYLVNSIVDGIGRKSLRVLDNLQIAQSRIKEQLNGISIEAASVGQVSEAMGRIATEELKKMGGFAETSATKVGQLETKWAKLKETVNRALTSPAVLNFFDRALEVFSVGIKGLTEGTNAVVQDEAKMQALKNVEAFKEMHITEEILKNKQQTLDLVQQEINTTVQVIARNNDILKQMKDRHTQLTTDDKFNTYAQDAELDRIIEQTKFYSFKNLMLRESINILKEYLKSVNMVTAAETPKGEEGDLVTDPVAFFPLGKKKPTIPMDSYRDQIVKSLQESIDRLKDTELPLVPLRTKPLILQEEWEKAFENNKEAIKDLAADTFNDQIQSVLFAEVDAYDARIDAARNFYDEQIALAGDNERVKSELRIKEDREIEALQKKRADREKKATLAGIVASTALGILRVFAQPSLTFAEKIIQSGIVAAQGASQYAIANRARYYAKGDIDIKGGTPGKDSIPAVLMPGESIMTTAETRSSKGIFKAIRAKKLNDRVLQEIVSGRSGGSSPTVFDDSKLLKKLDEVKNAQPDLVKQGTLLYEMRKQGESRVVKVRAKTMGY